MVDFIGATETIDDDWLQVYPLQHLALRTRSFDGPVYCVGDNLRFRFAACASNFDIPPEIMCLESGGIVVLAEMRLRLVG